MNQLYGFELIGRLMRKKHWVLDETMLTILFQIVGLKKGKKSSNYCSGIISNIHAFKSLLLDWKIWRQAPLYVQQLLLENFIHLVSAYEYARFNIERFR